MDAKNNETRAAWWSGLITYSARTDVGMKRHMNQDSYAALPAPSARIWRSRGHVFVVADGMGAHKAGELASKLAVTEAPQSYLKRTSQSAVDSLRDALFDAHMIIRKRGESDPSFNDMGTTCDMLVLKPGVGYIGHVGDSRVYRLRGVTFEQLTFDHSLAWEVKYYPNAHSSYLQTSHIPKNIITRSLGPTDHLTVDVEGPFETQPGDVFLMCSDGLSGRVADSEIAQILKLFSPEVATQALVNLANLRGGPDNCTVVVVRVDSNDAPDTRAVEYPYEKKPPLSMAAWFFFSLAFIAAILAVVFFVIKYVALGGSLCAVAIAALSFALFVGRSSIFGAQPPSSDETETKFKGPYVRSSAEPNSAFCDNLETTCSKLCEQLRRDKNVEPDWNGVDKARESARSAREKKDYAAAIRANISVVNYMMAEVRKYVDTLRRTRSHSHPGAGEISGTHSKDPAR